MFKRIDHVEIVTDQPERTVEFYTEVLGFKVRSRDRIDGSSLGVPMGLVYLDLGGTTVELISYEGASVEAAVQYLKTKGVEVVWGPKVREKYARAAICDPNGFHIELRQWSP